MNIQQKVKQIIADETGLDVSNLDPKEDLLKNTPIDSLDAIMILMAIEEVFVLEIPDEGAEKLNTIENIVEYVKLKCEVSCDE